MRLLGLAAVVVPLLLLAAVPAGAATIRPAVHYAPKVGDAFTFDESIDVLDGYGSYAGYTETDTIVGNLTITAAPSNGTDTAHYNYSGTYVNSTGADYSWDENGSFTFSEVTFDYVQGTDNETGYEGAEQWFFIDNASTVGSAIAPLYTPMTVESRAMPYDLGTTAGADVSTIYAAGNGSYVRDDSYGLFNAVYVERSYFDPATGFIVGFSYVEQDYDDQGDGFVYTDTLEVTHTSYPLTSAPAPTTYVVTLGETGLASGASWTAMFNGVPETVSTSTQTFPGIPGGAYLYAARASGYDPLPAIGVLNVGAGSTSAVIGFTATSSGPPAWETLLVVAIVALIVVLLVVAIVVAARRRARRGPPLPRHGTMGQPQYGAPPPISLAPGDQPRIQQVVVKEVVKVNCRYCGSLIDSTAEKCPFCGATRT